MVYPSFGHSLLEHGGVGQALYDMVIYGVGDFTWWAHFDSCGLPKDDLHSVFHGFPPQADVVMIWYHAYDGITLGAAYDWMGRDVSTPSTRYVGAPFASDGKL